MEFQLVGSRCFSIVAAISAAILAIAPTSQAQTAPDLPVEQLAGPGQSVTINVSNGSRATLSVGTSNAFGVTSSMSGMSGTVIESKASLKPLEGKISTVLGASAEEGAYLRLRLISRTFALWAAAPPTSTVRVGRQEMSIPSKKLSLLRAVQP